MKMKKRLLTFFAAGILVAQSLTVNAQFTLSKVKYWIGTGSDSSVLVVDFHDATWDTSYAWGYLHNAGATGQDMLNAVAAADANLTVAIGSGFLNDIVYGSHSGIGGSPNYWSTWSGTSIATMSMNSGISTTLSNSDWFACAYTDFSPALAPGEPIPAFAPFYFTAQEINFWVGTGTDTTLLVVDFLDGSGASSFAWGYLHSGTVTAEQMLNDIDAADPVLNVAISGGFLNDITYNSFSGIGGSPNYWGTWSATNLGNWDMNMGISTTLGNGDLFGCSYMNFTPVIRPDYPVAAMNTTSITDYQQPANILIYPNPATDFINITLNNSDKKNSTIKIIDATGKLLVSENTTSKTLQIPIYHLPAGFYTVVVSCEKTNYTKHFVKE